MERHGARLCSPVVNDCAKGLNGPAIRKLADPCCHGDLVLLEERYQALQVNTGNGEHGSRKKTLLVQ